MVFCISFLLCNVYQKHATRKRSSGQRKMHLDAQEREWILKVHNYSLLQWFRQKKHGGNCPIRIFLLAWVCFGLSIIGKENMPKSFHSFWKLKRVSSNQRINLKNQPFFEDLWNISCISPRGNPKLFCLTCSAESLASWAWEEYFGVFYISCWKLPFYSCSKIALIWLVCICIRHAFSQKVDLLASMVVWTEREEWSKRGESSLASAEEHIENPPFLRMCIILF